MAHERTDSLVNHECSNSRQQQLYNLRMISKKLSLLICIQFRRISWLLPKVLLVGAQREKRRSEIKERERGGKNLVFRGIHCKSCNNS